MPDGWSEAGTLEDCCGTQETFTESMESLNMMEESPVEDHGSGGKLGDPPSHFSLLTHICMDLHKDQLLRSVDLVSTIL